MSNAKKSKFDPVPDTVTAHKIIRKQTLWPQLVPTRIHWRQTEVSRTHFKIKPTTGGKIIHSSQGHDPKPETAKSKRLLCGPELPLNGPHIKMSLSHRELTSNFWRSLCWFTVSRLSSALGLSFRGRKLSTQQKGKTSFPSCRQEK